MSLISSQMANLVNSECNPQEIVPSHCEGGAVFSNETFSFSSCPSRRSLDKCSDQDQYIDLDLAIPFQFVRMARGTRLQKSLDSQEFEFNIASFSPSFFESSQVAPADELFYKGQLLPLQPDPRFQLVQTLSSNQQIVSDECLSEPRPFRRTGRAAAQFISCRVERLDLDTGLIDSRSSSFRSQTSSYWDSGEKDAADSGSSRDSSGSSQDSCFSGERGEKDAQGNASYDSTRLHSGKSHNQYRQRSSPFSWKLFFNGSKKPSKIRSDDRSEDPDHVENTHSDDCKPKRVGFSSVSRTSAKFGNISAAREAPSSLSRESNDRSHREADPGLLTGELQTTGGAGGLKEKKASIWTSASFSSMRESSCLVERDKQSRGAWHSRERWQRYVKKLRPLYVMVSQKSEEKRPSSGAQRKMDEGGKASLIKRASSPIKPPWERSLSQQSSLYGNLDCPYSSRYLAVASCPASMRSSPNHSGVLAVINKGPSAGAMQEAESSIQGAIAHCKQTHGSSKPVANGSSDARPLSG